MSDINDTNSVDPSKLPDNVKDLLGQTNVGVQEVVIKPNNFLNHAEKAAQHVVDEIPVLK